jgi:hypothetical protein
MPLLCKFGLILITVSVALEANCYHRRREKLIVKGSIFFVVTKEVRSFHLDLGQSAHTRTAEMVWYYHTRNSHRVQLKIQGPTNLWCCYSLYLHTIVFILLFNGHLSQYLIIFQTNWSRCFGGDKLQCIFVYAIQIYILIEAFVAVRIYVNSYVNILWATAKWVS